MSRFFAHNEYMSIEKFLMINGGLVILMALYMLWIKKEKPQPTRLNLRRGNGPSKSDSTAVGVTSEQELNVFFNHNAVMFDAYEVLGVPAGSPADEIEKAFEMSLEKVDAESEEIIRRAYQAIQERTK